jgi:hypothetical protein
VELKTSDIRGVRDEDLAAISHRATDF